MTVQALRRRSPEALEALLTTYGRELHGVAYLILRDPADAEDVVAETLLTAFDKASSIRDDSALRSWLIRVATNRAIDMRRRHARIVPLEVAPDRPSGADLGARSGDRIVLLHGLEALPPRTRAAVVLHYFADLTVEDTAAALGKSPNTIKTQLREALVMLRAHLAEPAPTAAEANRA